MFERLKHFFTTEPSTRLVEYIFVDRRRLLSYLIQLGASPTYDKLPSWNIGLSLAGPTVTGRQTLAIRALSDHEMITKLTQYLLRTGQLKEGRPVHHLDIQHGPFWIERMTAYKVIFPVVPPQVVRGLQELAIWVSNPAAENLNGSLYSEGTFLYLIESYWKNDEQIQTTFSGFSAFAEMIDALATTCKVPKVKRDLFDHLHSHRHPLEVMEMLGASVQPARDIESLYRLRYLSDEQVFSDTAGRHRSNDAYGYPIFITAV